MTSFCITTEEGNEILAFTPERAERWFEYFEGETASEQANRKKYLVKVICQEAELKNVLLDHHAKAYSELKSVLIDHIKTNKKKVAYYPVDHKIAKYRQGDIREQHTKIYESYASRESELPLELLKTNLPGRVKEYVRNNEATTID